MVADADGTLEDGLVADGGGMVLVAEVFVAGVDGTLQDVLVADGRVLEGECQMTSDLS